jgi:hypothetical protein
VRMTMSLPPSSDGFHRRAITRSLEALPDDPPDRNAGRATGG